MNETILLNEIEQQIEWYEKKCRRYKMIDTGTQITSLALAVSIPALTASAFAHRDIWLMAVATCLAFLEGLKNVIKAKEKWLVYRATVESIRREKLLYSTRLGPYRDEDSRVENLAFRYLKLTSGENETWAALAWKDEKKKEDQ